MKLLPCPNCKENFSSVDNYKSLFVNVNGILRWVRICIKCPTCAYMGPHASFKSDAIKFWNEVKRD